MAANSERVIEIVFHENPVIFFRFVGIAQTERGARDGLGGGDAETERGGDYGNIMLGQRTGTLNQLLGVYSQDWRRCAGNYFSLNVREVAAPSLSLTL